MVMIRLLEFLRRMRERPEVRLRAAGLTGGLRIADIGAGYGYYAIAASRIVGRGGLVYAVEPDPDRAKELSKRASKLGVQNVMVLEARAEGLDGIATGEVDAAIAMSSFHHFEDRRRALRELRRIVRRGGSLYIRDLKAGLILKHGSEAREFRSIVSEEFPDAEFEEDSRHVTARIRV